MEGVSWAEDAQLAEEEYEIALSGPAGAAKLSWRCQVLPLGPSLHHDPLSSQNKTRMLWALSSRHLARALTAKGRGVSVWGAGPQAWPVVVRMVSLCCQCPLHAKMGYFFCIAD